MSRKQKQEIVDEMQNIINTMTEEEITRRFNEVCNEKLFAPGIDYSNFPVYSNDYLLKTSSAEAPDTLRADK
jgi:hypothetical protein